MWSVQKIARSIADRFNSESFGNVVEAVQGEWQGQTDGLCVAKTGRVCIWERFGTSGDTITIPPSPHDYCAVVYDGADMNGSEATLKVVPVRKGETSVRVVSKNRSFFIVGMFVIPQNVEGER